MQVLDFPGPPARGKLLGDAGKLIIGGGEMKINGLLRDEVKSPALQCTLWLAVIIFGLMVGVAFLSS